MALYRGGHEGVISMYKKKHNYTLLTSREAAIQLNLSPDTVNALARSRKLTGMKVGRQWRFKKRHVTLLKKHLERVLEAA
jgi:excisionase family DNA binding protein